VRWLGLLVAAALLVSCSGGKGDSSKSTESSTTSTTLGKLASGPLADRVHEALALINDGTGIVADEFAPSFLAQLPEQQLQQIIGEQLHPNGPFTLVGAKVQTATRAELVVHTAPTWTMGIAIEPDDPHRITELLLRPEPGPPPTVASWGAFDRQLQAAARTVAVLAAEVSGGRCRAVHAVHPDRAQPLGSAFKLYVLGALAKAIQRGDVHWDDEVEVRDDLRVLSSAKYGSVPAGTKVPLQDLASAMISVSDNTATDLVLLHIGRDAVESSLADLGMRDTARNLPFVTTRELTLLKWGIATADRDAYVAAGTSRRRELLDALPKHGATPGDLPGASITSPTLIDQVEWFASPADLCRVHVALQDLAEESELTPVRSILSINPGEPLGDEWTYVAYKGGSEPGVLAGTWLTERKDGKRFVVAVLLENRNGTIEESALASAAAAFSLLAKA
jgi:hypothetical protein